MPSYTLLIQYADRPNETRTFEQSTVTIGRDGGDIPMHDGQVSGRHGEIQFSSGRLVFRDLGSTNGSFREDGQRIFGSIDLGLGETIRLGQSRLTVETIATDDDASLPDNDTLRKPKGTVFAGPGGLVPPKPGPPPLAASTPPHRGSAESGSGLPAPSSPGLPPPGPSGKLLPPGPGLAPATGLPTAPTMAPPASPLPGPSAGTSGSLAAAGLPAPGLPASSQGLPKPTAAGMPKPTAAGLPSPSGSSSGSAAGSPHAGSSAGLLPAAGLPTPGESTSRPVMASAPPMPAPSSGSHRLPPPSSSSTSHPLPSPSSATAATSTSSPHFGPRESVVERMKEDIGYAGSTYLRNAADGSLIVAVVTIPFAALHLLFSVVPIVGFVFVALLAVIQGLFMPLVIASLGRWALATVVGRSMNWQQAWRATGRNLVGDWVNVLLSGLVTSFGLLMLIVPGIIIGIFAVPIYLAEGRTFLDIHLRNAELVKDQLGRTFVLILTAIVAAVPLAFAFGVIASVVAWTPLIGRGLDNLIWAVAGVILMPFMTLLLTKGYLDLRAHLGDGRAMTDTASRVEQWIGPRAGQSHAGTPQVASLSSSSGERPIGVPRAGRSGASKGGSSGSRALPSGPPAAISGSFPAGPGAGRSSGGGDEDGRSGPPGGRLPPPGASS